MQVPKDIPSTMNFLSKCKAYKFGKVNSKSRHPTTTTGTVFVRTITTTLDDKTIQDLLFTLAKRGAC